MAVGAVGELKIMLLCFQFMMEIGSPYLYPWTIRVGTASRGRRCSSTGDELWGGFAVARGGSATLGLGRGLTPSYGVTLRGREPSPSMIMMLAIGSRIICNPATLGDHDR